MSAEKPRISQRFQELLEGEIQNRAFALRGLRSMLSKVSSPEDIEFYSVWIEFEEFNQQRYKPYAKKYRFSQEAGWSARLRASLANAVAVLSSEQMVLRFMLKETKKYVLKLEEMARIGPADDQEFLNYAVIQEELQVEVLEARLAGKTQDAVRLFTEFLKTHRG